MRSCRSTRRLRQAVAALPGLAEGRRLQIRRPRQHGRPAVLLGQGGDQLQLVRQPQRYRQEREFSAGPTPICRTTRRSSPSRSTRSSAGASLWTMTAPNRPAAEYKGTAEFSPSWPSRRTPPPAPEHRLRPVTLAGYQLSKSPGLLRQEPGHRAADPATDPRQGDGQFARPAAGAAAGNPQHHAGRDREGTARPADGPGRAGQLGRTRATACCGRLEKSVKT